MADMDTVGSRDGRCSVSGSITKFGILWGGECIIPSNEWKSS